MLEYEFMRNAFMAGTAVAIVGGAVGFFLLLRNLTFAGHALSHVGFAGAAGSMLLGINALWGLLAFTLAAGIAMGLLGERLRGRDVAVGIVLSLALGMGVLFLSLYTAGAAQATAILFGNVLGVSLEGVWALFKRSIVGAFHKISVKHLDAYLQEQEFRINNRGNQHAFRDVMKRLLAGEALRYSELVAPELRTP